MPDAKIEFYSFPSFGDITSQNFPLKSGRSCKICIFTPENGFNSEKMSFMSRFLFLDPILTPHVNFSNFHAEETFSFSKFLGYLDGKRAAAHPSPLNQVIACLKDIIKSHKVWTL